MEGQEEMVFVCDCFLPVRLRLSITPAAAPVCTPLIWSSLKRVAVLTKTLSAVGEGFKTLMRVSKKAATPPSPKKTPSKIKRVPL